MPIRLSFTTAGKDALRNTITALRRDESALNLQQWAETSRWDGSSQILTHMYELIEAASREPECRTVCCIGGWIAYFGGQQEDAPLRIEQAALKTLFGFTNLPDRPLYFPLFTAAQWSAVVGWQDTADESAVNVARNLEAFVAQGYLEIHTVSEHGFDWARTQPGV